MSSLALALTLALPCASAARAQTIAIVNGRVHTAASDPIERGTVLIRDGRIVAVGTGIAIPADAEVVDAAGKVVTPGLFDSSTQVGIVEIGAVAGTRDVAVEDDRITAAFTVTDALNPYSSLIPVLRVEGITRAVVEPSTGESVIAGQGAVIRLLGDDALDMIQRAPSAVYAVLGERGSELAGGSRAAAILRLKEALEDARDFAARRRAWETNQTRDYALSRLDLEALIPVVQGDVPLALHVDRAADILPALALRQPFPRLRLILLGAADGWIVADEIAAAGVPVVLNPFTNIPEFDNLGATLENAARLHRAGVTLAFASFDAHNARTLKQGVGNAIANGLPYDAALRAVTLTPARIWGVAGEYGTLEPGRQADVVVWSGDPFELLTRVEAVFIAGRRVPMDTRQEQLFERYRRIGGPYPPAYERTQERPQ